MSVHICPYFFVSTELPNTVQRDIYWVYLSFGVFKDGSVSKHWKWKWKSLSHVQLFVTPRTVHGILQVRIQAWVTYPFSRGSSQLRNQTGVSCIAGGFFYQLSYLGSLGKLLLLLLSHFSRVRLCATPETAAHQAPPSLGFSRQEHWSGLPFPSPMQESEKWKWSCSVVSDPSRPHRLQPTRLFHPWDFPGKSVLLNNEWFYEKKKM